MYFFGILAKDWHLRTNSVYCYKLSYINFYSFIVVYNL